MDDKKLWGISVTSLNSNCATQCDLRDGARSGPVILYLRSFFGKSCTKQIFFLDSIKFSTLRSKKKFRISCSGLCSCSVLHSGQSQGIGPIWGFRVRVFWPQVLLNAIFCHSIFNLADTPDLFQSNILDNNCVHSRLCEQAI